MPGLIGEFGCSRVGASQGGACSIAGLDTWADTTTPHGRLILVLAGQRRNKREEGKS
jgi:hypothetical protein